MQRASVGAHRHELEALCLQICDTWGVCYFEGASTGCRGFTAMLERLPESLGHALIHQRAGMEQVVYNLLHRERETARLSVTSPTFVFNGTLPTRYTADGIGISPPLEWDAVPQGIASFAILVEDADSPTPHPLVQAIVVDLASEIRALEEGSLDSPHHAGAGHETGRNSYLKRAWLPPDPPRGHGTHRYVFQVFALIEGPNFGAMPGRREFIAAVLNRAVAVGCLIGVYERSAPLGIDAEVGSIEGTAQVGTW